MLHQLRQANPVTVVRAGELPRGLPLHEDVDAGEAAARAARGPRRGHRRPRRSPPAPAPRSRRWSPSARRPRSVSDVSATPRPRRSRRCRCPPAGWTRDHGRRRRGQRRRRADDRGGAGRRRARGHRRHQGRARRRQHAPGPRAASPPSSVRTTTPNCTCTTPWSPAPASATRTPSAPSSTRRRPPSPGCRSSARRLDLDADGRPALTREGGHSRDRIVHAGGDASGAEVTRTLAGALRARGIEVLEHTAALDALRTARRPGRRPAGGPDRRTARSSTPATCARGPSSSPPAATARSTPPTTNPAGATGDGLALALRAGAEVADVEMVQFHPTVLWTGSGRRGASRCWSPRRCAARAPSSSTPTDGAIMAGRAPAGRPRSPRRRLRHDRRPPRGDRRGPRLPRRHRTSAPSSSPAASPASPRACRAAGLDLAREPVPVAPAAHYTCGGVLADLDGRTERRPGSSPSARSPAPASRAPTGSPPTRSPRGWSRPGAAPTLLAADLPRRRRPGGPARAAGAIDPAAPAVDHRGRRRGTPASLRDAAGLAELAGAARRVRPGSRRRRPRRRGASRPRRCTPSATLLARRGRRATESRGCHRRADAPGTRPEWQVRLVHRIDRAGHVHTRTEPVRTLAAAAGGRMSGDGVLRPELAAVLRRAGLDPAEVVRVVRARPRGGPRLRPGRDHELHRARRTRGRIGDVVPAGPGSARRAAGRRGRLRPRGRHGRRGGAARRRRLVRRARQAGAHRHRADPVAAHRRAHGPEPGQPPLRAWRR